LLRLILNKQSVSRFLSSNADPSERYVIKTTSASIATTGGGSCLSFFGGNMGKLFYGTMTGNTTGVAEAIQAALPDLVDEIKCIDRAKADDLRACDFLILGGSTWGDGELTDDWADFLPQLDQIDFSGKTVALFALGDQVGYGYNFVSAMKILYDKVLSRGAHVIACHMPTSGFEFEFSASVVNDSFVGLVVDEQNEPDLTADRIAAWAAVVRQEAAVAVA
jgi:flavodoxin I